MILVSRLLTLALVPLLAFGPLWAQTNAPGMATSPAEALQIRVEGAAGSASGRQSRTELLIQVSDGSGAPVSEAAVTVRLPEDGPSGVFADGKRVSVSYTDQAGRTLAGGIQWNGMAGTAAIRVTATKGVAHAGLLVEQTISAAAAPPAKSSEQPVVTGPVEAKGPVRAQAKGTAAVREPGRAPGVEITSAPAHKPKLTPPRASVDPQPPAPRIATEPETPQVSVTGAPDLKGHHGGRTKWIVMAAIAAGAAGGLAVISGKSKSSSSSGTPGSSSVAIGTPTISVGHP